MNYSEEKFTVSKLVDEFQKNALLVNPEYQRGAVWTSRQQGKFLDSIFRGYPVPAIFIRAIQHDGLLGQSTSFELIDGQQRLRALSHFLTDRLCLPPLTAPDRLRVPANIAREPADWAGKTWNELRREMQDQLKTAKLPVFVIQHPSTAEEVRDLFIRLQAGTALSRQQIRDAWPGPMAPFVVSIGGKGRDEPKAGLLSMVGQWGDRSDDDARDRWVNHRQTCAQMLSVFLDRERDPYARARISADDLDDLYHEATTFDPVGEVAKRFRSALDTAEQVFDIAADGSPSR